MKMHKNSRLVNSTESECFNQGLNSNRVYFELPSIEIIFSKEDYPWHLRAVVEFEFDKNKTERLQAEIDLQLQIGQEVSRILDQEGIKYMKAGAYIKKGTIVHDFYLERRLKQPTLKSTTILMGIMAYRGISFDLNKDREWKNAKPYFNMFECDNAETLFDKLLDLNTSLALVN